MKKKNEKKILLNNEFIGFIDFSHSQYFLNTVYDCIGKVILIIIICKN